MRTLKSYSVIETKTLYNLKRTIERQAKKIIKLNNELVRLELTIGELKDKKRFIIENMRLQAELNDALEGWHETENERKSLERRLKNLKYLEEQVRSAKRSRRNTNEKFVLNFLHHRRD